MSPREKRDYALECAYNIFVTYIPSHRCRQAWLRLCGVEIGPQVSVFRGCTLQGARGISLAEGVTVGWRCHLDGRGGLSLGPQVTVASDVHLITAQHDPQDAQFAELRSSVLIEEYAWLATRSMVLPGNVVGRGAVVAAGAVVTRDVPAFAMVAGVPAQQIGTRTESLTYRAAFRQLWY